ncbi:hypothetical protein SeMB42_g05950 [Synchytrium endobioticum]|uniref:Rab-GAP TBC domain-containing protein n=1 Tax=Synchytrium endobioticum TaxID=286115 RepID=A0A507CN45_9FUNG|nr:hypothetical protein SeMB42_g05950 [Synchytrium endobioticum]
MADERPSSSESTSSGGIDEWRRINALDHVRRTEGDPATIHSKDLANDWLEVSTHGRDKDEANNDGEEDMTEIFVPPEEDYVSIDYGYLASITPIDESTIERDRYGFRRVYDAVNRDIQNSFDLEYDSILVAREMEWNSLFESAKKGGLRLPKRTNELKRLVRKGVPRKIRGQCWYYYSGAQSKRQQYPELFAKLCAQERLDLSAGHTKEVNKIIEHIDIIDKDLLRTFPDNIHFKTSPPHQGMFNIFKEKSTSPPPYLASLRRILVAFAYYSWPHPDARVNLKQSKYNVGYCQALNFVVGMLLLGITDGQPMTDIVSSKTALSTTPISSDPGFSWNPVTDQREAELRAFWILAAAIDDLLPPEMYGSNLEGVQIEQDILWRSIMGKGGARYGVRKVARFIGSMETNGAVHGKKARRAKKSGTEGQRMPPLSMITTQWFLTMFVNVVPTETLLRIWDVFFYQGEKNLMRVTLTLLKIHEETLTQIEDPMEAWRFVKDMGKSMYDCENLLEICFKSRISTKATPSPMNMINGINTSSSFSPASPPRQASLTSQPAPTELADNARPKASTDISRSPGKTFVRSGVGSVSKKDLELFREKAIAERAKQKAKEACGDGGGK